MSTAKQQAEELVNELVSKIIDNTALVHHDRPLLTRLIEKPLTELIEAKEERGAVKEHLVAATKFINELQKQNQALMEVAKAAIKEVYIHKTQYIDWSLISSYSPDHDPSYKPKYPEEITVLESTLVNLQTLGIELE